VDLQAGHVPCLRYELRLASDLAQISHSTTAHTLQSIPCMTSVNTVRCSPQTKTAHTIDERQMSLPFTPQYVLSAMGCTLQKSSHCDKVTLPKWQSLADRWPFYFRLSCDKMKHTRHDTGRRLRSIVSPLTPRLRFPSELGCTFNCVDIANVMLLHLLHAHPTPQIASCSAPLRRAELPFPPSSRYLPRGGLNAAPSVVPRSTVYCRLHKITPT
jgi:hypothetical protein